jgi:hypothetical protein
VSVINKLESAGGGCSLDQTPLWLHFPANREFIREILRFWALFPHGLDGHAAQFTVLSPSEREADARKEQGILLRHQGIEFPCYGVRTEENLQILCELVAKNAPNSHYTVDSFLSNGLREIRRLDW